jgi:hypothetical protein
MALADVNFSARFFLSAKEGETGDFVLSPSRRHRYSSDPKPTGTTDYRADHGRKSSRAPRTEFEGSHERTINEVKRANGNSAARHAYKRKGNAQWSA